MACDVCGGSPCTNPSFCAQARAADQRKARGKKPAAREEPPPPNGPGDYGTNSGHHQRRVIPLVPFDEIKLGTQRRYLIKGLIPRVGLTVVWGPPKCGKSFWTFNAMMHVALGWKYHDRRVHQGPVIYCAFEGQTGMQARVEAFRQHHGVSKVPFFLQPLTLNLIRDVHGLIAAIKEKPRAERPAAVVLDTLNRSIEGSESSDEDMTAYIRAADAIRETFECAVVIVHHCGLEQSRPRGHTSLFGANDAQLAVTRDRANNITVTVEYMKDGPQGDVIASKLEQVQVGTDEDGEPITSCVVVPTEVTPATKAIKLRGPSLAALRQLNECLADCGRPATDNNHVPRGAKTVTLPEWKNQLQKASVIHSDGNPREEFRRIRVTLLNAGSIGVWEDIVWAVT